MSFSIRLSNEERMLAESYAKIHSLSLGEAFKKALFERIEDEYDLVVASEAHEEYVKDVKWYVVHTYSGYENKVKANLDKIIENRGLQDQILEVIVPMEEQIEIKDGKRKTSLKKVSWNP